VINIGKRRLQLPAGYIDKGYTPLSSAKRELKEETGHLAKKWFCLGKSSMGKWSTNDVYYYLALDAYRAGKQELEESEDIKVRLIPLDKFLRLLRAGKIDDNLSVTCALFSLDRLRS
jgi:8-oxo-dGTP pyrophosphatase MutT (NUDIX family)